MVKMKSFPSQLSVYRDFFLIHSGLCSFMFVQLQPRYPRVMEKVARQIESLRAEQPNTKV